MAIVFNLIRKEKISDTVIVNDVQHGSKETLERFYEDCYKYFNSHYSILMTKGLYAKKERAKDKDDLFSESFEFLWTEIENKRIIVIDGQVHRLNKEGMPQKMTCSLTTFLMSIAQIKLYEQERENWCDLLSDYSNISIADKSSNRIMELSEREAKIQIVDNYLAQMHDRCKEILTMFYYAQMSLDEILSERKENYSKDGLKTGKYKCLKALKETVTEEFKRRGISV